jgi:hypothetical protein
MGSLWLVFDQEGLRLKEIPLLENQKMNLRGNCFRHPFPRTSESGGQLFMAFCIFAGNVQINKF